ncbi:MAG: GNAT family N-acetyltransferase [Anaerolineales bacterium]|nr:GNAT family N-acetyltransferase [Anaerolineales bacterium]
MQAPHIRLAQPGDEEAIRAVTLAAFEQYATRPPIHWPSYQANILATLANVGPATQLVAELESKIVGTVLLYPAGKGVWEGAQLPHQPEVRLLAVPPEQRGRGIGRALMEACLRQARAAGDEVITLHTIEVMEAALHLYERLGFVRAPHLDFSPAPGLTIHGYWLRLND